MVIGVEFKTAVNQRDRLVRTFRPQGDCSFCKPQTRFLRIEILGASQRNTGLIELFVAQLGFSQDGPQPLVLRIETNRQRRQFRCFPGLIKLLKLSGRAPNPHGRSREFL